MGLKKKIKKVAKKAKKVVKKVAKVAVPAAAAYYGVPYLGSVLGGGTNKNTGGMIDESGAYGGSPPYIENGGITGRGMSTSALPNSYWNMTAGTNTGTMSDAGGGYGDMSGGGSDYSDFGLDDPSTWSNVSTGAPDPYSYSDYSGGGLMDENSFDTGAMGQVLKTQPQSQPQQGDWLGTFLNTIFGPGPTVGGKQQPNPLLTGAGALYDYIRRGNNTDMIKQMYGDAAEKEDLFAKERPFYMDRLKQSYLDPNFFANDPAFKGIGDSVTNDLTRKMAAMGYSQSPGNMMGEIGSALQNERMKYAMGYQNQLGQLAGANMKGDTAGLRSQEISSLMGNRNQQTGNISTLLQQLPSIYGTIKGALS